MEIYCDESRQDLLVNKSVINPNNKYVLLGGIWIDKDIREDFKNEIKKIKLKHNINSEFKWNKVSINHIDFYKDIINLFFNTKKVAFRALVIDSELFDIEKYHNNSGELGFYKCYYELLNNWIKPPADYNIYLDYRKDKSKARAYELKKYLNNIQNNEPAKIIQFINSKESLLLQLEDVIMGAVAYKYNFKGNGKSIAKNKIVNEIEKYYKIEETGKNTKKFNIFRIKLRGENND